MANVFYLHWNREELEERAAALEGQGHTVRKHWSTVDTAKFGDDLPEVFVISLDRLPSHGKAYAEWIWEAKKRRDTPIIFEGGKPGKRDKIREEFPNAIYCESGGVAAALEKAAAKG